MSGVSQDSRSPHAQARWVKGLNVGSADAPPHGLVEIVGVTEPEGECGEFVVQFQRPTCNNKCEVAAVGPVKISAGKTGPITFDFPAWVLVDSTGATGDNFGTEEDSFIAKADHRGLRLIGGSMSTDDGDCQRFVRDARHTEWAMATLDSDLTATDSSVAVSGFESLDACLTMVDPSTADNPLACSGSAGDTVLLKRRGSVCDESWIVVSCASAEDPEAGFAIELASSQADLYPYGVFTFKRSLSSSNPDLTYVEALQRYNTSTPSTTRSTHSREGLYSALGINTNSRLFVSSGNDNRRGRGLTGFVNWVWCRLPKAGGSRNATDPRPGKLFGPIRSKTASDPFHEEDAQALYPGLPGFRCLSPGNDFTDHDDATAYRAKFIREPAAPFAVVAIENWTYASGSGVVPHEQGLYNVKCKVVEYIPIGYHRTDRNFESAYPELIYDGHDDLHPDVEVIVDLYCMDQRAAPNVVVGQAFMVRPKLYESSGGGPKPDNETDGFYACEPVGDWWRDMQIGTIQYGTSFNRGNTTIQFMEDAEGWRECDGTSGTPDLRDTLPMMLDTGVTWKGRFVPRGEESIVQDDDHWPAYEGRYMIRIDNSEYNNRGN